MRAAVFHGQGDIRIEEVPEPNARPDALVIEVRAAGICGTDAHEFSSGPHMFPIRDKHPVSGHNGPMIPGHEFSGIVHEVGPAVDGFAVGDLVVSGAGTSCGLCVQCRRGRTNLCVSYSTIGLHQDGALAQFVSAPASTCVHVEPFGLTQDAAALAQPMSIAVHAMRRGRLERHEQAVVVGAGAIGAFLTFALAQEAGEIAVMDLDNDRLKIAGDLGASHLLNLRDHPDAADGVRSCGMEPTVVYEVSGTRSGLITALSILSKGGRLVLVGLHGGGLEWDARTLSLSEHEIIGTNAHVCSTDLPAALELLSVRPQPWSDIAPRALTLDHLVDGGLRPLADHRSGPIKTLIDPWATHDRPTVMQARR